MSDRVPDRTALEALWKERARDARLHLELARKALADVVSHAPRDGNRAHEHALQAERLALKNYTKVLKILADLLLDGRIPGEPRAKSEDISE